MAARQSGRQIRQASLIAPISMTLNCSISDNMVMGHR
jgi:hypothetical protein